jgi:hypothetical protein
MAKVDPNSELLAEALAKIAALEGRLAFVESINPIASALQAKTREQKERAVRARAAAIKSVAEYDALSSIERAEVPAPVLIEILRASASKRDRARVVASLKDRWRVQAMVAFALAPAPKLVEVTSHRDFEGTRPVPLVNEAQVEQLEALGLPVEFNGAGEPLLRGFTAAKNETLVLDAAAWSARVAADDRLRTWLDEGKVTARAMSEDEARQYTLRRYMSAHTEAIEYGERTRGLPQLPELS